MPIYEYECKKCGHQTEVWQKFSESPLSRCEVCNGKLRKLISQSAFHLKGTGWYVTDYASKGGSRDAGKKKDKESPAKETKSADSTPSTNHSTSSSNKNEA
jgi:putative FmdB family regulatory protein